MCGETLSKKIKGNTKACMFTILISFLYFVSCDLSHFQHTRYTRDAAVQVYRPYSYHPPLPASEKSSICCGVKTHLLSSSQKDPQIQRRYFYTAVKLPVRRLSDHSTITNQTHTQINLTGVN